MRVLIRVWWQSSLQLKTNLESSWAPVHKLNGSLGLDCCNSCIHILGYHITTVQQTTGHVFAVTRVTFNHLIGWLKTGIGYFRNTQLLVVSFLSRDNRSIGGQREVDTWVWHQVGLHSKHKDIFKNSVKLRILLSILNVPGTQSGRHSEHHQNGVKQ